MKACRISNLKPTSPPSELKWTIICWLGPVTSSQRKFKEPPPVGLNFSGTNFLEQLSPLSWPSRREIAHCLKSTHLWGWLCESLQKRSPSCHRLPVGGWWRGEAAACGKQKGRLPTNKAWEWSSSGAGRWTMFGPESGTKFAGTVRAEVHGRHKARSASSPHGSRVERRWTRR